MRSLLRFLSYVSLAITAIIVLAFAAPIQAKADTYTVDFLHSDQGVFFFGMDDSGHVVLSNTSFGNAGYTGGPLPAILPGPLSCAVDTCYYTFLNGVSTGPVFTAPSITSDNGTPCSPSVPAGGSVQHGVCNNGRDAFSGFLNGSQLFPGIYTGAAFQSILPHAGEGYIYMDALGDIVFDDHFNEAWYEAIPSPTPEPASLLLLTIGGLGLVALAVRRRDIHATSAS